MEKVKNWVHILNGLELLGILSILIVALLFQFLWHDLPCPLCLLQRFGFMGIAFGLLLNLRCGLLPSHYTIVLLSALFTSFVAIRQIVLHIVPGTGVYGEAFLGLHLYTWSFIVSMLTILYTSLILGIDRQYKNGFIEKMQSHWITHGLFVITLIILCVNIILLILQCGFSPCPENPVEYKHLHAL